MFALPHRIPANPSHPRKPDWVKWERGTAAPAPTALGPHSPRTGGSVAPLRSRLYRRDRAGVGTAAPE